MIGDGWADRADDPAETADYWLEEMTTDGSVNWYGPACLSAADVLLALALDQNQPSPFNPRTTFRYSLPDAGHVRLALYDLRGALLATLVESEMEMGERTADWDGHDARGAAVPSGVYMARLETASGIRTVKVTLSR